MRLYARFAIVLTGLLLAAFGLALSGAAQSQTPAKTYDIR